MRRKQKVNLFNNGAYKAPGSLLEAPRCSSTPSDADSPAGRLKFLYKRLRRCKKGLLSVVTGRRVTVTEVGASRELRHVQRPR